LGAIAALVAPAPAARQVGVGAQERARLLQLQRDAVARLQQAARIGALVDEVRSALLDTSGMLERLGAAAGFDASLGADLRRARADLKARASRDTVGAVGTIPSLLTLLEKARTQLEGEVALGLTFQGSYSQTKPKDPASGGHASAMGPAPPNIPIAEDG